MRQTIPATQLTPLVLNFSLKTLLLRLFMLIEAELSFSVTISVIWFDIKETILNVPAKIKAPTPPITPPVVAKAPLPLKNDIARFFAPPFEAAFRDLWVPPPLTLLRQLLD